MRSSNRVLPSRREALRQTATAGLLATEFSPLAAAPSDRVYRIGIVNCEKGNGHTWHFFQGFHAKINEDALVNYQDKEVVSLYHQWLRNPRVAGVDLPFTDTRISHVYDKDPQAAKQFAAVFVGARPVDRVDKMVGEVDGVLLGDAIGNGADHLDLLGPVLEAGLPTFCDKPLAASPARARAVLALAEKHKAPLMSSSLFRHFPEVREMARLRRTGELGPLRWLTIGYHAACIDNFLLIYGIHSAWAAGLIAGFDFEAVSVVRHDGAGFMTITYKDRPPVTLWMGGENRGVAYFARRTESFPLFGVDGPKAAWHVRYSRTIADLALTIREMIRTRRQPFPAEELLNVVAITHAAVKSAHEKGRLVALKEVL